MNTSWNPSVLLLFRAYVLHQSQPNLNQTSPLSTFIRFLNESNSDVSSCERVSECICIQSSLTWFFFAKAATSFFKEKCQSVNTYVWAEKMIHLTWRWVVPSECRRAGRGREWGRGWNRWCTCSSAPQTAWREYLDLMTDSKKVKRERTWIAVRVASQSLHLAQGCSTLPHKYKNSSFSHAFSAIPWSASIIRLQLKRNNAKMKAPTIISATLVKIFESEVRQQGRSDQNFLETFTHLTFELCIIFEKKLKRRDQRTENGGIQQTSI